MSKMHCFRYKFSTIA